MNFKIINLPLISICLTLACFSFGCQSKPKNNSVGEPQAQEEEQKPSKKTNEFFTIDFAEIIKDKREVQLSEFAESVEFIQFENSPKALLGRVMNVMLTKNFIFVKHSGDKRLTQFNRKGKFIRHFGTIGRGPKEYALMRIFSLDQKNELIYIQTNWTRKMLVYNFDGEYLRTLTYPTVEGLYNVWARDSFIVSFCEPYLGFEPNTFIEPNFSGDTIQTIENYIFWEKKSKNGFINSYKGRNTFYWVNNNLHMKGWYNDTVYTYDNNNKINPKYYIDLKEHKIPEELIPEKRPQKPLPKECYWVGVHETANYIFIPYGYHYNIQTRKILKEDEGCVLYNKRTKEGIAVNENIIGGFTNDLTGGPDFKPLFTSDTTAFVAVSALDMKLYLESDKFKNQIVKFPEQKEKLVQLNKTLKEDDNHFLMVVKLK